MGKGVVYAKDTANFVANRILTFGSTFIMHEMMKDGLSVEEVDALTGPAVGHASSATFRTADLVGLDTLISVVGNVVNNCPDDEQLEVMRVPEVLLKMRRKEPARRQDGFGLSTRRPRSGREGQAHHSRPGPGNAGVPRPDQAAV
jgi:3-hydroxyacyl-CoA dehydrogenase